MRPFKNVDAANDVLKSVEDCDDGLMFVSTKQQSALTPMLEATAAAVVVDDVDVTHRDDCDAMKGDLAPISTGTAGTPFSPVLAISHVDSDAEVGSRKRKRLTSTKVWNPAEVADGESHMRRDKFKRARTQRERKLVICSLDFKYSVDHPRCRPIGHVLVSKCVPGVDPENEKPFCTKLRKIGVAADSSSSSSKGTNTYCKKSAPFLFFVDDGLPDWKVAIMRAKDGKRYTHRLWRSQGSDAHWQNQ